MDPNAVVLEISSDEEVGWDGNDDRLIPGGFDDNNWILAELLDEFNGGDCGNHDGSDDSDEVVLVSEVLPSRRPKKKPTSNSSSLIQLDDDCVVLDHDPDKPMEVRNDTSIARAENEDDDDSDDLLVVSETGQVACRDYPHPRHLCIKFPFSSTPNESHCDQCYCYVCDSLAPCLYWGNGSVTIDHCHATEKIEFWKLERQNLKNKNKVISVQPWLPPMNTVPPTPPPPPLLVQTPSTAHITVPRPNPIRVCPISPNLGPPNIINQNRTPFLLPRDKYQPGLVSQQLIRTSSCTIPGNKMHHNYNLSSPFSTPVFKRTVSPGVSPTGNRHFYNSRKDNYRNIVNSSGSFPPVSQPQVNSDSYVESPIPFQPQLLNYPAPCEASQQQNHGQTQRSTVDPKFFHGINWPESRTNHLPAAQTPPNEPFLAADSGELVNHPYDDWGYDNQSLEIPGSFGLNELSHEPTFLDTGTIFDF
ncbi:hypothetical protein L2E82_12989 [Cichorium intybus]|uniref:Uncharacterized protein n=1 Tax=Cichorium intybus TaxID=13427 RepID=A0ACB9GIS7_CICIN|nr:hypothetical protein L2E82_12989 [Cichorium intybus]